MCDFKSFGVGEEIIFIKLLIKFFFFSFHLARNQLPLFGCNLKRLLISVWKGKIILKEQDLVW